MTLKGLKALGFDKSYMTPSRKWHLRCSQCEALAINGVPTHEQGCPNQKFECKGCNTILDYNGYCENCQ